MPDERAIHALSRIDRALARIENAAAAPSAENNELVELREAHRALRGHVEGAISHIDSLLVRREGAR